MSSSAATAEPRTLEELVEAGEVEAALLLKGAYTKREMELVRDAWAAGIKMGKEIERSRQAHGLACMSGQDRRLRWRVSAWLLNHPSRLSWIAVELLRPRNGRKLRNAWWQARHYGDVDAFQALYETHRRSYDAKT